ncbi:hypothetical protein [Rhodococcus qingshengii]|uniref:hypothetical protein n=1 Tax=Rhodococcus qingshengii TaxID=334542 RepID=UPI0035DCE021
MSALYVSVIRTVVPIIAGGVISAAAFIGLELSGELTAVVITTVVSAVYYTVFRFLEDKAQHIDVPWLKELAGKLLGMARPPEMDKKETDE